MKVVAALALVVLVAGCGGGKPLFTSASGWEVGSRGHYGWASTVRYRDCRDCVPPHRTIAALPAGGVVIQVQSIPTPTGLNFGSWPLRIRANDVRAGFEGVPHRYGFYEFSFRRRQILRSVFLWFGTSHPTRAQLARANAELARLQI